MGLSLVQETFTPVGDICLLKEVDMNRLTKGGLALPDSVKPLTPRAEVIAVGKGRMLECGDRNVIDIKVGDIVAVSGPVHGLELEGQPRMMLVSYSQITGVIR